MQKIFTSSTIYLKRLTLTSVMFAKLGFDYIYLIIYIYLNTFK